MICILIFSIFILLGQNKSFAQEPLQLKVTPGIYDGTDFITNLKPNQALMLISAQPAGPIADMQIFTYTDIVKNNHDFSNYRYSGSALGRYYNDSNNGIRHYLSLIDDKYFYVGSTPGTNFHENLFPQINQKLREDGLGTLLARQNYISFLSNRSLLVSPTDFRGYLQPWIIVGLVIAILIPAWYLMRRFLRG